MVRSRVKVAWLLVAVLGCGPVGLFSVGIASVSGAGRVIASDARAFRLNLARTMGADATIDVTAAGGCAVLGAVGAGVDGALAQASPLGRCCGGTASQTMTNNIQKESLSLACVELICAEAGFVAGRPPSRTWTAST